MTAPQSVERSLVEIVAKTLGVPVPGPGELRAVRETRTVRADIAAAGEYFPTTADFQARWRKLARPH